MQLHFSIFVLSLTQFSHVTENAKRRIQYHGYVSSSWKVVWFADVFFVCVRSWAWFIIFTLIIFVVFFTDFQQSSRLICPHCETWPFSTCARKYSRGQPAVWFLSTQAMIVLSLCHLALWTLLASRLYRYFSFAAHKLLNCSIFLIVSYLSNWLSPLYSGRFVDKWRPPFN